MSYVGLDETGRIQSVTEKQEYAAPGAIEFEFPEGFDLTRIDDFLIQDGQLVESPREPTAEQVAEMKAAMRRDQMDAAITMFVRSTPLTDAQALSVSAFYEEWEDVLEEGRELKAEEIVQYGGELYRVAQNHTPQAQWEPGEGTESLYTRIKIDEETGYEVWKKPTGAHDAYSYGDIVLYPDENGEPWISTVDGEHTNTWEPGVYGWEKYEGD